ncbi:hypothetical protein Ndes2526B_g09174 [Nannochloris sp. 'desiccata']|nr:hypothetical protein KSW81_003785 [Chlorella desiccata (nom. nud.)]KAH7615863.1 putative ATP-dependent DNA helicase 2 subunit KU70 [Chlorella desiccata (nom. nud.)]
MTDHFDMSAFLDDADDDVLEMEGGFKEYVVIMIDAQPNMLEPCTLEDKMFQGKSWLEASVHVAAAVLRTKVIQGATDEVAVMFFNTRAKKNDKNMGGVYVKHKMGEPDAGRVLQLKNFNLLKDFNGKIGAGSSDVSMRNECLENGFWIANALLPGRQKTGSYVEQRVVVFTRDAAPGTLKQSIELQAENIAGKGGLLQLAPLFNPQTGEGFDLQQFWGRLLSHAATNYSDAATAAAYGLSQAEDFSQKYGYEDNEETVLSLKSLSSVVRMRAYRKRAITRINWTLGPGGATIGVKLYQTIKAAWPGAKGAPVQIDPIDNKPLVKTKPTNLDAQTGIPLEQGQQPRLYYPSKGEGTFPIQYATDFDEIKQLKFPVTKGISLLGFKPVEDLKQWHQIREATFIFPDEGSMPGSLVAFASLLTAMIEREVIAVCTLVRGPRSEPRLVALVPQQEVSSEETGAMITPAGMYMHYLPFADEIRYPELDTGFTGTERPQPSQEAVDVAAELIAALNLYDGFDPADIPNPHMQHWLKMVEQKAITLEAENEGDSDEDDEGGGGGSEDKVNDPDDDFEMRIVEEVRKVEDLAVPDANSFAAVGDVVDCFIVAVCGAGFEGQLMGQKKKGTKRPAPGSAAAGPDASELNDQGKAAALEALDFPGKFAEGKLSSFKNDDLKLYCECHGLKKGGNKAELVARITEHLDSKE